ncbi:MAG: hypothetical protein WKF73_11825 [Nocardioidaceae bacterium]
MMPTNRYRILLGAAAGLLSAAAGVGASMIVSVVVGGAPTPITAVGGRVIDLTPGAVKDWAIRTLGESDKLFLLGGMFTAIALLACITGGWSATAAATGSTDISLDPRLGWGRFGRPHPIPTKANPWPRPS